MWGGGGGGGGGGGYKLMEFACSDLYLHRKNYISPEILAQVSHDVYNLFLP